MSTKKENRRVSRLKMDHLLKVVMGSMGSNVRYDLGTKNISTSGFFLAFEKPGRFPFTPASIMEVWLQLEPDNTIFFNGKMARVVQPNDPSAVDTGPGIAIKIVQINKENEEALKEFINRKLNERKDPKPGGDNLVA